MIDTRIPPPAQTGEMLVSLFVGADNVDDVSQALNLPLGQVAAWCERIRTAFGQPIDESPRWHSESGEVKVTHIAEFTQPLSIGTLITFVVTVQNGTRTTLYGVHLIQRGFTNASMATLTYDRPWQFVEGDQAQLPPQGVHKYIATYRLMQDDLIPHGDIVNAIAISGRTVAGQHFYEERDVILELSAESSPMPRQRSVRPDPERDEPTP